MGIDCTSNLINFTFSHLNWQSSLAFLLQNLRKWNPAKWLAFLNSKVVARLRIPPISFLERVLFTWLIMPILWRLRKSANERVLEECQSRLLGSPLPVSIPSLLGLGHYWSERGLPLSLSHQCDSRGEVKIINASNGIF